MVDHTTSSPGNPRYTDTGPPAVIKPFGIDSMRILEIEELDWLSLSADRYDFGLGIYQ